MVKPIVNKTVEILMGISFVVAAISAFAEDDIHKTVGLILIALIIIHLVLHYRFIFASFKNLFIQTS
jgi:hypothetical protein